ncbi:MAG: hypothetical protein HFH09_02115 [Bacilli bacterium]|jgi:hypothetical protein|nr:hypothetical protein [Bacilli bacterium]
MYNKLDEYLNQDIDNPKYLFHGSPYKLDRLIPQTSHDSKGNKENVATAIFLFPSFLKSTPYAFMGTIIANSEGLPWDFEIPNSNSFPLMTMSNVNIDENMVGYIYVFEKSNKMIKDEKSYQYKCYDELAPCDMVTITYKDFYQYYELRSLNKSMN